MEMSEAKKMWKLRLCNATTKNGSIVNDKKYSRIQLNAINKTPSLAFKCGVFQFWKYAFLVMAMAENYYGIIFGHFNHKKLKRLNSF